MIGGESFGTTEFGANRPAEYFQTAQASVTTVTSKNIAYRMPLQALGNQVATVVKALTKTAMTTSSALAATVTKQTTRKGQATSTTATSILKQVGKPLLASSAPLATRKLTISKPLQALGAQATSLVKSVAKSFTASSSLVATHTNQTGKPLQGTSGGVSSLVRQLGRALNAAVTTIGFMARGQKALATTPAWGSLTKTTGKQLQQSTNPVATRNYSPSRIFQAIATGAARLIHTPGKALGVSVTSPATSVKSSTKTLGATTPGIANVSRGAVKVLLGVSTMVGSLRKASARSFQGSASGIATGARATTYRRVLLAATSGVATIRKAFAKVLTRRVNVRAALSMSPRLLWDPLLATILRGRSAFLTAIGRSNETSVKGRGEG